MFSELENRNGDFGGTSNKRTESNCGTVNVSFKRISICCSLGLSKVTKVKKLGKQEGEEDDDGSSSR